jgi:hypothetical protein
MSYTVRCSELQERLERARLLLYFIELGVEDAEQAPSEDPRDFTREYCEWLKRVGSEVESEVRELEQALGRCGERFRDLLAEILRDLRGRSPSSNSTQAQYPPPRMVLSPALVRTS